MLMLMRHVLLQNLTQDLQDMGRQMGEQAEAYETQMAESVSELRGQVGRLTAELADVQGQLQFQKRQLVKAR